jgi:hypothetical protein
MNPRFAILCIAFSGVFGFSLYLLACTASIDSDYQADIGRIRWLNPFLVLVLFFIASWFLASKKRELRLFLLIGLAECVLVFVLILVVKSSGPEYPTPPTPRTLMSTVGFSLAHPQFSKRSYAVPFYSAMLLGILWLVYRVRCMTATRNP